jgi:hypothetical protein
MPIIFLAHWLIHCRIAKLTHTQTRRTTGLRMVLTPCDLTFVDSWPGQSVQLAAAALPGPVARDYGDVFQLGSGLHSEELSRVLIHRL